MTQGTVKFFNGQRGFDFIQPADGSKDVFVHISADERAGMNGLQLDFWKKSPVRRKSARRGQVVRPKLDVPTYTFIGWVTRPRQTISSSDFTRATPVE
jgi:'Cold-shock' DNA-binding domain